MKLLIYFFLLIPLFISAQDKLLLSRHHIEKDGEDYHFFVSEKEKMPNNFDSEKFYTWYKAQRIRETQGGASGELLNGSFQVYFENKQLKLKGNFKNGLKSNKWNYWRNDGTLIRIEDWSNGKLKSTIRFNESGEWKSIEKKKFRRTLFETALQKSLYSKDSLNVKTITFLDNGKKLSIKNLREGKLHGLQKTFENGKLVSKERYIEGQKKMPKEKKDKSKKEGKGIDPKTEKEKKPKREKVKNHKKDV